MIDKVLTMNGCSARSKIAVKSLITVCIIALGVALPQVFHIVLGQAGGAVYLPMYLPVLLGACLLGARYGAAMGIMSPLVSFVVTSLAGEAMPALGRLPFMMFELLVFGVVAGLFATGIARRSYLAFAAVISAQILGRGSFIIASWLLSGVSSVAPSMAVNQVTAGWPGLLIQIVAVPAIVMILGRVIEDSADDRSETRV